MKRNVTIMAVALAVICAGSVPTAITASGGAAVEASYTRGTNASGVLLVGGGEGIVLEKQSVTFNVPEFPAAVNESTAALEQYSASVTTEYTFYNPTEEDVSMDLLLPIGPVTEYEIVYNGETGQADQIKAPSFYSVSTDGAAVEATPRYTYFTDSSYGDYDPLVSADHVRDGYATDLISPEEEVREYQFTVTLPNDIDDDTNYLFWLELEYNPVRTQIVSSSYRSNYVDNGRLQLSFWLRNETENVISFSTIGDPVKIVSERVTDNVIEYNEVKDAIVSEPKIDETTFGALVESNYPAACVIGKTDWYNGAVDALLAHRNSSTNFIGGWSVSSLSEMDFMRWLEYSVTIPAGEKVSHVVSVPFFPHFYGTYCSYTYHLSPSRSWEFGTLEVTINTPYYVVNSSFEYTSEENGFTFSRETLPLGNIEFSLSETETIAGVYWNGTGTLSELETAFLILGVIVAVAVAITVILIVRNRKLKNKRKSRDKE